MPLTISRTAAFRHLQGRIGFSTYRLNTIFVGLQHISEGGGAPDDAAVAIGWKPPKPEKAKETADQARIFVCASALVLAADVFDSFLREFARQEWLRISEATKDVATKAKTRGKEQGGDYSVAERADALASEFGIENAFQVAAIDLFAKWRNVIAHTQERGKPEIATTRAILLSAEKHIYERYRHLDIGLALANFDQRKMPVAKEVTTLIAIAVNFSRSLDEAAIRRSASTPDQMVAVADSILRIYFRESRERTITPWAELSALCQGGRQRRINLLKKILSQAGITENQSPVSTALPSSYLMEIIGLTRDELADRLQVERQQRGKK